MTRNNMKWTLLVGIFALFTVVCKTAYADCDSCGNGRWDCCGVELSAAQPCCEDCGWFVGAEYLNWTVHHTNLDYAVDSFDTANSASSFDPEAIGPGRLHLVDYGWDPGLRLTLGYRLGCDGWDVRLIYTKFDPSNSDKSKRNNANQDLKATALDMNGNFLNTSADLAKGTIELDYQALDLLLSRPFCVSRTLILRPFFGVRGVWLDQTFKARYLENTSAELARRATFSDSWEGAGLHAGLQTYVRLNDCLSLYGSFAGSVLGGRNNSHHKELEFNGANEITYVRVKAREYTSLSGLQLGTGVSWSKATDCGCFELTVGYEMTKWFQAPHFRHYDSGDHNVRVSSGDCTDILFHGLTVGGHFYF